MREEFPLIEFTLMDIMGDRIRFDESEYHITEQNLHSQPNVSEREGEGDKDNEREKERKSSIFKQERKRSQSITNIYHLYNLLNKNGIGEKFRANYFEIRSLSAARQLLMNTIISKKQNTRENNSDTNDNNDNNEQERSSTNNDKTIATDFALKMLNDSCILIDKENVISMQNGDFQRIEYKPVQLAQIFDNNYYLFKRELNDNDIKLGCMIGLQNSILAINIKDWDNNEYSQNIHLPKGWSIVYDIEKIKQIFYWRLDNTPTAFMNDFFGFQKQ